MPYMKTLIAIIGEFDESLLVHEATVSALEHSAEYIGAGLETAWVSTTKINKSLLSDFDGFFLAPGFPYKNQQTTLRAIRYARENGLPCLGTCRGFQYMVLEFARNVLGIGGAAHEEAEPDGKNLFLTQLSSTALRTRRKINIETGSRLAPIYRQSQAVEIFFGKFGVNPKIERRLAVGGLVSVASEEAGSYRIAGIESHPFFYVPQMRATKHSPHPIITGFLKSAILMQIERARNKRKISRP